jgi:nucleoside phosphorylase
MDTYQSKNGVLICFAVKEEAAPFRAFAANRPDIRILVTGMGAQNTRKAFAAVLTEGKPSVVITCGYAGGLNPALPPEALVLNADANFPLTQRLIQAGAKQGTYHCASTVAITAQEKAVIFTQSKCDAVEMESGIIRQICAEQGIPAATFRVISDAANENLPLNFNELMTPQMTMDFGKLAWALVKSPGKIPELMRFGKRVQSSAKKLGAALAQALQS